MSGSRWIVRTVGAALAVAGVASVVTSSVAQTSGAQKSTKKEARKVGGVAVWGIAGEPEFFTRGRFYIDTDGAPNAYHPGYKCDAPGQKHWKVPVNVDCATRSEQTCHGSGFDSHVAYGEQGNLVHCRWRSGACVAEVPPHGSKHPQGGCTPDRDSKKGLDDLESAGSPGNWAGIVVDKHTGEPFVQKATDPFPGFYVSGTSLQDHAYPESDPRRYVDATKINFVALPPHTGAQPGDVVVVVHWPTKRVAYAIFGDGGITGYFQGEGSPALASALGLGASPRGGGTERHDVVYLVFPGRHLEPRFPRSQGSIDALASGAFAAWGGLARLEALSP